MRSTDEFVRWCGVAAVLLLVFPLFGFLRGGPSPGAIAAVFAVLGIFVLLFVRLWLRSSTAPPPSQFALGTIACLAVLAVGLNLAYPGQTRWLSLFAYVVPAAGFALTGRTGLAAVALTVMLTTTTALVHRPNWDELEQSLFPLGPSAAVLQLLLIGLGAAGVRGLIDTAAELRTVREELARLAVEEERLRFSRDLHDLLGHSLSIITLKSELAGRLLPHRPREAAAEIEDIERVARGGLREVRDVVTGYRRATLASELASARAVLEAAGIECRVEDTAGALPMETEATFAWTVREGVTNVARHSHAGRCGIRLCRDLGSAILEITDDGLGGGPVEFGHGLLGLRERIGQANGCLEAGPLPTRGFHLRVTLPLATTALPPRDSDPGRPA